MSTGELQRNLGILNGRLAGNKQVALVQEGLGHYAEGSVPLQNFLSVPLPDFRARRRQGVMTVEQRGKDHAIWRSASESL